MRNVKDGRFRNRDIHFMVSEYEHDLLMHNFKESHADSFRDYATKILADGYFVKIDTTQMHEYAMEINKIGVNINQAVHKINSVDSNSPDIFLLKKEVEECKFLMEDLVKTVRRHWIS